MSSFAVSECFPPDRVVRDARFSQLDEADSPFAGSLVYCQNLHFLERAERSANVSAVITTPALAREAGSKGLVVADDPRLAFFRLYMDFAARGLAAPAMAYGTGRDCRIHPAATVSPRSCIGDRVEIAAGAVIEDNVRIGDDCYIGPNAVVGAEGLLTVRDERDRPLPVRHAGGVELGDRVTLLAGAVVAKSLFRSFTSVGDDTQVGIMATIGHGVRIAEGCVISGNTLVAGRTRIERRVWVGASASIAQGLVIGAEAQVKMGSVVVGDVAPGEVVSGNFAMPHARSLRNFFQVRDR